MEPITDDQNMGGRPRKISDPAVLEILADMKMTEQLSWDALAEWYQEAYGETIHPHTLRSALIRDGSVLKIHERASKQVAHALENVFDKVDILRLITYAVNGRFTEWSLIYERVMQSYMDEETIVSPEQIVRMDQLWNELTGFFLKALEIMKQVKGGDAEIPELEILIKARPSAALGGEEVDGRMTPTMLIDLIESVSTSTESMLRKVHDRHRQEGHGFYRVIPDAEEDLMEVDE